jgi:hypothetical protein
MLLFVTVFVSRDDMDLAMVNCRDLTDVFSLISTLYLMVEDFLHCVLISFLKKFKNYFAAILKITNNAVM